MRLLTAGSLVRAQQGEPEKSASGNRCVFSFAKRQRPCALIAARADGVRQSKTERTNKRRGAAVNCAGAERARWAMQRGGGGPGNRAMCRGPVTRGAARQFPGSEWSLVRAGQGEPEKSALGNRCAFSFAKRQRPCALIAARADGVRQSKTERTNKTARGGCYLCRSRATKNKSIEQKAYQSMNDRYAFSFSYKEPQAMLVGESSTSVEQKKCPF